jgi:hypothetical protein
VSWSKKDGTLDSSLGRKVGHARELLGDGAAALARREIASLAEVFEPRPDVFKSPLPDVTFALHAFGYSFDLIEREGAAQQVLQLSFQDLALSLL